MAASIPTPFLISFPEAEVTRMMHKVKESRLPESPILPGASWDYGIDLDWLKSLKNTWENDWSWEETEKKLNRFPHFRVDIEDLSLHFIHVKSKTPGTIPILLLHGWPSSFLEFTSVIDSLANPSEGEPAFDVVVPSLPGYCFSSPATRTWTSEDTARVYNTLMVNVLGYKTYGAVGGDLGTRVITSILNLPPNGLVAAHFTMLHSAPPTTLLDYLPLPSSLKSWYSHLGLSQFERNGLARQHKFLDEGRGYRELQKTRPATIGASLFDNPVGILAYIGEKFHAWSDPTAPASPSHINARHIITQAALHHLTDCIHTSFLPYRDYGASVSIPFNSNTPIGYSNFPFDVYHYPLPWLEKSLKNLVFARQATRGGHFAAMDAPEAFVEDVREMMGKHFPRSP